MVNKHKIPCFHATPKNNGMEKLHKNVNIIVQAQQYQNFLYIFHGPTKLFMKTIKDDK